jgi:hypothetical protein
LTSLAAYLAGFLFVASALDLRFFELFETIFVFAVFWTPHGTGSLSRFNGDAFEADTMRFDSSP